MRKIIDLLFIVVFFSLLITSCGGGGSASSDVTATQLSATSDPVTNTIINSSTPIVISFNQSTDVSTLVLGGTLASESDGGVWSNNSLSNDTLTITPQTVWTASAGGTITVSVSNEANDSSVALSYIYPVDSTAPVVSAGTASNATLSLSAQIVIQFNESMNTSSLTLSGSMESESDGGIWSTTSNSNDTLTISPTTLWSGNQLSIDVTDVAGNSVATLVFNFTLDSSTPTALVVPANGSLLANAATVTITFSEAMDTSSLVLSGVLSSEDDGGVWSTVTNTNDTLTVSPSSEWAVGIDRTFVINAADVGGSPISEINLSYDTSAVFVSTSGNNAWTGTSLTPKKTVQAAIDAAQSAGIKDVLIQAGTYTAVIEMKAGVNVTGGYDTNWTYDVYTVSGHNVILVGGLDSSDSEYMTVKARNINTPTLLQNLSIQGPNASGNPFGYGRSSYAVHTTNSSGMNLSGISIAAGDGAIGQNGSSSADATQAPASSGVAGGDAFEDAVSCDNTSKGAGGAAGGASSLAGGIGGNGGTMDTDCTYNFPVYANLDARPGTRGGNAAIPGYGGSGGSVCVAGQNGDSGLLGTLGSGGTGGSAQDGSTLSNFYMPTASSAGSDGGLGSDGAGGGGGGGSGGCDTGTDSYGAGGGGGGAGGVQSVTAGGGGESGGSSFGIYAYFSTMQLTNISISRGNGSAGGNGANGALGQPGGTGGSGGAAVGDSLTGGDGGNGGLGGSSGSGGGGAGGNSYGIFKDSAAVTETQITFTGGVGGVGGAGGSRSGTSAGSTGSSGGVYTSITAP